MLERIVVQHPKELDGRERTLTKQKKGTHEFLNGTISHTSLGGVSLYLIQNQDIQITINVIWDASIPLYFQIDIFLE